MGKFFFVIFLQENFGVQFLPEGSTPQWEGGAATAQYVQLARVLFVCIFFLGTLREFLVHPCVHTCACAYAYLCKLPRLL